MLCGRHARTAAAPTTPRTERPVPAWVANAARSNAGRKATQDTVRLTERCFAALVQQLHRLFAVAEVDVVAVCDVWAAVRAHNRTIDEEMLRKCLQFLDGKDMLHVDMVQDTVQLLCDDVLADATPRMLRPEHGDS